MKKYIIMAIVALAACAIINAQSFRIITKSGDVYNYNTADVDYISFSDESLPEPEVTVLPFSEYMTSITPAEGTINLSDYPTGISQVAIVLNGQFSGNTDCTDKITLTGPEVSVEIGADEVQTKYYAYYDESAKTTRVTLYLATYPNAITGAGDYTLTIPEGFLATEDGDLLGEATFEYTIPEPAPSLTIGNITVNVYPTYASVSVAADQITSENLDETAKIDLSYKLNDGEYKAMDYNERMDVYTVDIQFAPLQPGEYTVTVKAEATLDSKTVATAEKEAADKITYAPTPKPIFIMQPDADDATITETSATFPMSYTVENAQYALDGAKMYIVATNFDNRTEVKQEVEIASTPTEVDLVIDGLEAGTEYTYAVQLRLEGADGNPITVEPGNIVNAPKVTFTTEKSIPAPAVGMYYYSDGTWGEEQSDNAIGIIFKVGLGNGDSADNYPMLDEVRGYVVAPEDASTMAKWDNMPSMLMDLIGISKSTSDFIGYKNTQQLKEFNGQPFDQFPAAYAAVNYKVEAPATSSGWYLPSAAEMSELYNNSIVDGKDYWTSTEHSSTAAYYLSASGWFGGGIVGSESKSNPHAVRSVLAF